MAGGPTTRFRRLLNSLRPDPAFGFVAQSKTTPRGRTRAAERDVDDVAAGVAVCFDVAAVSARPEFASATATAAATAVHMIAMPRRAVIHQRYTGGSAAVLHMSTSGGRGPGG